VEGPRIVVALDLASVADARAFIARVSPDRCRLKVGLELYTAAGPTFVRDLVDRGFGVFLDLKFHDIPNTVERACRQAAALGVELLTVHCLGGRAMLEAARRGASSDDGRPEAREEGRPDERSSLISPRARPKVLGVTLLTSLASVDLSEIGLAGSVADRAAALAELARAAGLDGVVCAPTEAEALRRRFGRDFLLVTPGVRPAGTSADDQQRVLTPREAIARGADLLVIGRPITRADDPAAALDTLRAELPKS
jgi:orotidine-5'-phosphate decarboxylase